MDNKFPKRGIVLKGLKPFINLFSFFLDWFGSVRRRFGIMVSACMLMDKSFLISCLPVIIFSRGFSLGALRPDTGEVIC
ncbi:MAG: hypothetical protein ACTSWN_15770, partial [Promethearchaeota archaeon]